MPRPKNTEQRRAQIVDGLLTVMARDGYERATIAAIGRAAGLTPGLVHYHFKSKQAVLVALVRRLARVVQVRYEARLQRAGDDPLAQLHAFIDAHVELGEDADERAVSAWVTIGAEAIRQVEVREIYAEAVRRRMTELERLFAAALRARGVLRSASASRRRAKGLAAALLSAIEGAYQLSAAAGDSVPRGFAAPTLRALADAMLPAVG